MRGRIVIAVILLAAALFALRLAIVARDFDAVVTAAAFASARDNHTTLRVFLNRMPKGGDLHTHLSGAVYAEHFIAWAAARELCVDIANMLLAKLACERTPDAVAVVDALRDQRLYDRLVNAFSMRAFLPTPAVPTGHDEFFATFDQFNAASSGHFVDMAADQLRQYDRENVHMSSSWCRSIARTSASGCARQSGTRPTTPSTSRRCNQPGWPSASRQGAATLPPTSSG
jgi:adenosine deaminase